MKIWFVLFVTMLSFCSCMTYNHGYTVKKGETELSIDSVAFTDFRNGYKISPPVRAGIRYGIFDYFNIGLNSSLFYSEKLFPTLNPYLMLSFFGTESSLNFAAGVDILRVAERFSYYPSMSAAYSYRFGSSRPFVGLYVAPTYYQPYLGFEYELERLRLSLTAGVGLSTVTGFTDTPVTQYYLNPGLAFVF